MKLAPSTIVLLFAVIASPAFAQESSRKDFQEYCQAFQGRWVGDITWVADWPGLGKKGEKVTAYSENTVAEDGNALITKFYGGNGSGTGIVAFDARAKQIKWMWVSSGGYVGQSTLHKVDGKWVDKGLGSTPDGTKNEYTSTVTITDNGNTHTWTGTGTLGGEQVDDQHDVWRRVSQ
ncbi:hypothetical protein [Novipirellula artificiosorum]|uniref:DUF1579 domain-containing protein n=1 Tax=Novipirellula artificiosorum TaxID=2528016 RepID=A0A5C6DAQ6_9BACT|nr:hypothetical protein [Novipirellula artificiosorum]TWU33225.1 hypothetical protein Poly41_49770 [Novipirellula artificiosorum]